MPAGNPVQELSKLRRAFGRAAASAKLELLDTISKQTRIAARDLVQLQASLDFMRAYPDNVAVRRACRAVISGLRARVHGSRDLRNSATLESSGVPGSTNLYSYSFEMSRSLSERFPACLEVAWDDLEDEARVTAMFEMLLTRIENEAMEDVQLFWSEWTPHVRPPSATSDLSFVLSLFRRSQFSAAEQANLYEGLDLPIRYKLDEEGTGRCEIELPRSRVVYQQREIERERFDLRTEIRRPLRVPRALGTREARAVIDVALRALASRNLEIHPLLNANPRDVVLFEAERGFDVALVGVLPEHRGVLAALYFFVVLKNGVPVAYGPASPFLGSCEMGINLFPEFRGAEIRYLYAQVMRLLYHALAIEYFYLTSYGMGDGNEEAIQSGAFWFYRGLGFSASNPECEALAQAEEARMRAQPGYRSSTRTLRRLAPTEAYLDLSNGRCQRFPFGKLGLAVSRFIAERYDGDRGRATRACSRSIARALAPHGTGWSSLTRRFQSDLSLVLAMIPDFANWSADEKAALARIIEGKTKHSEARAAVAMKKHRRFREALWSLVAD